MLSLALAATPTPSRIWAVKSKRQLVPGGVSPFSGVRPSRRTPRRLACFSGNNRMARVFLQRALNRSPEFDPYQARRARNALGSLGARGRETHIALDRVDPNFAWMYKSPQYAAHFWRRSSASALASGRRKIDVTTRDSSKPSRDGPLSEQ